ncbi:MAG TPA: ABC transporter permease [Candidatus Angelobacter sp.]|nr:ABC transporter permease [Candidatus Angelobacter sp.]
MSVTAGARSRAIVLRRPAPSSSLAGTGALLRLALRRDRVRLTAWVAFAGLLTLAVAQSWDRLYPTAGSRRDLAASLAVDPTLSAVLGPLFDPQGTGALTVWRTGSGSLLALGLVACFLVVRHSRADEDEGRGELALGAPVGRAAPLAAALLTATVLALAWGLLCAVLLGAVGLGLAGSLAFGLGQAGAGLVLAAFAGVTSQVARTSRGANGLAGVAVGAALLVTAAGNARPGGSPLQYLSPFGWAQQTRAYAGERWFLAPVSLLVAACLAALALHIAARRDLGDGLLLRRHGSRGAASWVSGPVALAWRLDRTSLLTWAAGFAVLGAVAGVLLTSSVDLVEGSPGLTDLLERLAGGSADVRDAFLVDLTRLFGLVAAGFGISTALRLRAEEEDGRAELVLSGPRSRVAWVAGHASTALLGSLGLLVVGGLCLGLVHGAADGEALVQGGRAAAAALLAAPAVLLLVAVSLALVGVRPAWSGAASWTVLLWCVLTGFLGGVLGLPDWLRQTSPFGHVPPWPAEPMTWAPVIALIAGAVALVAVGVLGLRRRDVPA